MWIMEGKRSQTLPIQRFVKLAIDARTAIATAYACEFRFHVASFIDSIRVSGTV